MNRSTARADIAGKDLANPLGAILTGALSCATPAALKQKPQPLNPACARSWNKASAARPRALEPARLPGALNQRSRRKVREVLKTMLVNA